MSNFWGKNWPSGPDPILVLITSEPSILPHTLTHTLAHTGHMSGLQLSGTSISSVALGQCLHTVQAIQCYACIQLHGSDLEAIQYQGVNLRRPYLPRSQNQSISSDLCWGPGGLFISWKYLHWVKPNLSCVWQLNFILREDEKINNIFQRVVYSKHSQLWLGTLNVNSLFCNI